MKKQLKPWLYVAAVLLMSVSCKKEVPNLDCDDGTCCSTVKSNRFRFVQFIENAPADFWARGGGGFVFSPEVKVPEISISICEIHSTDLSGLKHTSTFGTNLPAPYKYRIWAKVYQALDARVIIDKPVYFLHIQKWEETK